MSAHSGRSTDSASSADANATSVRCESSASRSASSGDGPSCSAWSRETRWPRAKPTCPSAAATPPLAAGAAPFVAHHLPRDEVGPSPQPSHGMRNGYPTVSRPRNGKRERQEGPLHQLVASIGVESQCRRGDSRHVAAAQQRTLMRRVGHPRLRVDQEGEQLRCAARKQRARHTIDDGRITNSLNDRRQAAFELLQVVATRRVTVRRGRGPTRQGRIHRAHT